MPRWRGNCRSGARGHEHHGGAALGGPADLQCGRSESAGFPAAATALAEAIRAADGVIIVSPEYNYGVPGGLKNAVDWVSRMKDQPFKDKPIALQSVAGGPLGGGRVQYQWRQIFVFLEALVFTAAGGVRRHGAGRSSTRRRSSSRTRPAINFIKQQLAGFEKFIRKAQRKG